MQDWLKAFHGANQLFPAMEIAIKMAVALALGLLVGLERERSSQPRLSVFRDCTSSALQVKTPTYFPSRWKASASKKLAIISIAMAWLCAAAITTHSRSSVDLSWRARYAPGSPSTTPRRRECICRTLVEPTAGAQSGSKIRHFGGVQFRELQVGFLIDY